MPTDQSALLERIKQAVTARLGHARTPRQFRDPQARLIGDQKEQLQRLADCIDRVVLRNHSSQRQLSFEYTGAQSREGAMSPSWPLHRTNQNLC